MPQLAAAQIKQLAEGAGFSGQEAIIATAIALAESGGRTDAQGDTTIQTAKWGPSVGLWQIRSLKNPGGYSGVDGMRDANKLTDPAYNAKVAYALYKQKGGWNDWSVYRSGAYKKRMQDLLQLPSFRAGDDSTTAATPAFDNSEVEGNPNAGKESDGMLGLGNLNSLAGHLQDSSLWKRAGLYVGGYALLVGGLLVILLSNKEVQTGIKSAAGAAVTVVPGGGVVKGAAKGVGKVVKRA